MHVKIHCNHCIVKTLVNPITLNKSNEERKDNGSAILYMLPSSINEFVTNLVGGYNLIHIVDMIEVI